MLVFLLFLFSTSALAEQKQTIKFGVLSIAPPARIFAKWQPFADHMSRVTGYSIELVVPRGFKKMKRAVVDRELDIFYINSHVFYRLKQEGHAVGLAQMKNIAGGVTSKSEIFVRRDSGIKSVDQLKGKLAFVSPMAAGGYLAPRAFLYKKGLYEGEKIKEVFTKNLSNSIHGVLLKDYRASTMCGVNFKLMSRKIETGELFVLGVSDEFPEPLLAARPDINQDFKAKFTKHVLSLPNSEAGKELLISMHSMKIQKFVAYDEKLEKVTVKLLETAHLPTGQKK